MKKFLAVLFSTLLVCTCGAILSACGEPPHEHNYTNYVYNNDAECEVDGTETATCDNGCGESHTRTKEGSALQHSYTDYTYNNDAECEVDGTETAYCDHECGESHTRTKEGSALQHSYTNYVYNNDAKCEIDGTETAYCDHECGESHTRTKVNSALSHNYGEWISNGDNTHTKTCSHDNTHKITENCGGGEATCSQKAVCSSCNIEYGNLEDHPYSTEWTITETHHYHASTCDCEEKKDYGEHTPDDSGFCTACDKAINYTNGIIYDTSGDGTYVDVIGYEGSSTKINIAPTYNNLPVKSIYDSAFNNANITKVIIPDSVTSIGISAFSSCSKLTSVTIGNSVTSIGNSAFSNCSKLTSIEIPDSVTTIEKTAFYYCSSLASIEIPDSVTSIGSSAFSHCESLTSVTIGDSVTSIGGGAFYGCSKLISIEIPDSVTYIGQSAFYDCPEALFNIEGNVKYLISGNNKYFAVLDVTNKNLSSYTIKDGAKIIADYAFNGCSRLSSIEIPDSVTYIGEWSFWNCSSLASIEIPDSVTYIGKYAFNNCSSLTKVNYLGTIDQWAQIEFASSISNPLYYAKDLYINDVLVTEVVLTSATKISKYAFYYCTSLTSVTFKDTSTWYKTDDYENWINKTGGSQTDVTNPARNASSLKQSSYYWYKL